MEENLQKEENIELLKTTLLGFDLSEFVEIPFNFWIIAGSIIDSVRPNYSPEEYKIHVNRCFRNGSIYIFNLIARLLKNNRRGMVCRIEPTPITRNISPVRWMWLRK